MSEKTPDLSTLSLEQLVQNINSIAQILSRLTADIENGTGLLWQPLNSLLTSLSALSGTLTTNNLIMGSGLGTVAAKTLSEVIDANFGNNQGTIITRGATLWDDFAVGTSGQFLKTQGAAANVIWADAFVKVALQVFTVGGTYTATTGMMFTLLGAVGGGAGGGGVANSSSLGSGGGGGGGSTSLALKTFAQYSSAQTVTIGGTANGGTAGNNDGTAGNDSSIGSLVVGKGGSSTGTGAAANTSGGSGAGGVVGTGDIRIIGGAGGIGDFSGSVITPVKSSGAGGSSGFGFGAGGVGVASLTTTTGASGTNYGGGGSGGYSRNTGGAAAGGVGAAGIAFALDFCKV